MLNRYYTVMSKDLEVGDFGVSMIRMDEAYYINKKDALLYAVAANFKYLESKTDVCIESKFVDFRFKWKNGSILESIDDLNGMTDIGLNAILTIQKDLIIPKCDKRSSSYTHKIFFVKEVNII